MKVLVLLGSGLAIVMSLGYIRHQNIERFEYPVLIVLATLGMAMMISANDLMSLYLGLELQSLALYVVAAFRRDSARSSEAGLKYFVLGALASGMLLYGCSLIYGFTGTTSFAALAARISPSLGPPSTGVIVGLVFVDRRARLQRSRPCPSTCGRPMFTKGRRRRSPPSSRSPPRSPPSRCSCVVMIGPFAELLDQWQQVIMFIAVASMLLGAFAAIWQSNIKRLMAYSSIGHVGYALVGLAAGSEDGSQGRAGLLGDLSGDERRRLRVHPVHAARRRHGRAHRRPQGAVADPSDDGAGDGDLHVLARGHPAARGLLRQVLRLRGGDQRGSGTRSP